MALGDSLTEGVGDPHPRCPNGLRGWADLVARHLATTDSTTEYANLALRAKRAADVLDEQVDAAVAMCPDVVSLWVGGNDILRPVLDADRVLVPTDAAVRRLASTGATVLLLTGFELTGSPVLALLRRRVITLNAGLREIAHGHRAVLVDVSDPARWAHRDLWAPDRVHPSPLGHARLAREVAGSIGLPLPDLPANHAPARRAGSELSGIRQKWREESEWWRDHVVPHVRRWVTQASAREEVAPKWAVPIRPATEFRW